ncbi:MAG: DUF5989 family protein [Acidobacteriota bacterium]
MANDRQSSESNAFEREAHVERTSLPAEFWQFIVQNKKWWLIPIVTVLFLFGVLMLLGSTAAAPFIYTLF